MKRQARNLDLPVRVSYPVNESRPIVVMTWKGSRPELPSIMLSSHMNLVPVDEKHWNHPPFAAERDENGNISARGIQDMKSIGMNYLGAIRALKRQGINQLNRTVHVVYAPDKEKEETYGMAEFVKTPDFKQLNVGIDLYEGGELIKPNQLSVVHTERVAWKVEFVIHGRSGHGSRLYNNTAVEKMQYILNKFMELRENEAIKMNVLGYPSGNVTSINLTVIKGGSQNNVIPSEIIMIFDVRHSTNADVDAFEKRVRRSSKQIKVSLVKSK